MISCLRQTTKQRKKRKKIIPPKSKAKPFKFRVRLNLRKDVVKPVSKPLHSNVIAPYFKRT